MNNSDKPSASSFPLTNNSGKVGTGNTPTERKVTVTKSMRNRPRTGWTYVKWVSATLMCLCFMAGGFIIGRVYWGSTLGAKLVTQAFTAPLQILSGNTLASYTPDQQFAEDKQHVINVLLLGCDADYENGRPVVVKGAQTRSDSIMIARINFDNKSIKVMSFPRDTAVRIPDHGIHKLNAAHAFGGPEMTQRTMKEVFGIDTDYYVTLDFVGFKKVVNAIGGVDLNVDKNLNYDDNWGHLHVHLKPGMQHLDGEKAMGYVRMRHSDSDLMRSERQHNFMEAMREKVKSPSTLLKLSDVLNAITDSIKSNMTEDQMLTLVNFARQIPRDRVAVTTLPVIEGPSYVYVKVAASQDAIRHVFYDDNPVSVDINVPSMEIVRGLNEGGRRVGRHRKHRGEKAGAAASAPLDDNGEPMVTNPDETMPPLDGASNPTGDTPTDGAGGQTTTPDAGGDTGKKSDPAGDGGAGKSGGDAGTTPAPPPGTGDGGTDKGVNAT